MAITSFLFFFALLFSCYLNKTLVYGAERLTYHVVDVNSLVPGTNCSASTKGKFHGLQIASRYGPCSPFAQEHSTPDSSKILMKDEARVRSINSSTSNKYTTLNQDEQKGSVMPLLGLDIGAGNFVVTVGFGTPKRDYALIFDTGSDVTWMRCKLCSVNCQQTRSIYNPAESSTFSNASCSSSSSCDYSITYGDKSYSKGYYIRDTLTILPSEVFPNFVFGCGQTVSPHEFGNASGLLGLGQMGSNTLLSQTNSKFSKTFCHCLPVSKSTTGYVWFGPPSLIACQKSKFTPLLTDRSNSPYYFVNLTGITFGELRLNVSSYSQSSPTTILDSATVMSRLPPLTYSAIRSTFQKSMSQYQTAEHLNDYLDTCYSVENHQNVKIPSMVLHFANSIDVNLDSSAVIWTEDKSHICLAFMEQVGELTIIGNHQLRNLNVLYDIQNHKVGFRRVTGCGN